MIKMRDLLTLGGRVILAGLLVAVLSQTSIIQAMEATPSSAQTDQEEREKKKEKMKEVMQGKDVDPTGGIPKTPCKDKDGDGACMTKAPAGEQSINGGKCTTGRVCLNPNQPSCVLNGTLHCKNYDMGGGKCACPCM